MTYWQWKEKKSKELISNTIFRNFTGWFKIMLVSWTLWSITSSLGALKTVNLKTLRKILYSDTLWLPYIFAMEYKMTAFWLLLLLPFLRVLLEDHIRSTPWRLWNQRPVKKWERYLCLNIKPKLHFDCLSEPINQHIQKHNLWVIHSYSILTSDFHYDYK